jgi:hypothetical protein
MLVSGLAELARQSKVVSDARAGRKDTFASLSQQIVSAVFAEPKSVSFFTRTDGWLGLVLSMANCFVATC